MCLALTGVKIMQTVFGPCSVTYDHFRPVPVLRARAAYLLRAARSRGPSHRPTIVASHDYRFDLSGMRLVTVSALI
jgi:hypothetical protein